VVLTRGGRTVRPSEDPEVSSSTSTRRGPARSRAGPATPVRRHPLGSFLTLTFLLSWGYWIPLAVGGGAGSHVPGLLGPALAALIVSAIVEGPAGPRELGVRMVRWRVPLRWYLAAIGPLLLGAVTLTVVTWTSSGAVDLGGAARFAGLPEAGWGGVFVLLLVVNGFGEEVGWRGFAWPRLRRDRSLAVAAGLLVVPWAVWHLPTFWLDTGMDLDPVVIPGWLVGLAAGAVVLGWLYERTGSLLIVALFHASLNVVSGTDVGVLPSVVTSVGIIAAAVALLRREAAEAPHGRSP
jgi:uncharacterized protein